MGVPVEFVKGELRLRSYQECCNQIEVVPLRPRRMLCARRKCCSHHCHCYFPQACSHGIEIWLNAYTHTLKTAYRFLRFGSSVHTHGVYMLHLIDHCSWWVEITTLVISGRLSKLFYEGFKWFSEIHMYFIILGKYFCCSDPKKLSTKFLIKQTCTCCKEKKPKSSWIGS